MRRPSLLPFADQRQQALKDVFITGGDLAELADGLGTTLGGAYVARAHYLDRKHFTNVSQAVADVIAYALATSGADSNSGKYFFANATTDGKTPVSDQAAAILADEHGVTDVFGIAYGRPRGGPGADAYGDSRPFQTEPHLAAIAGPDYFNVPSDNVVYNRGPAMNLVDSPSFPSGHTTYGYTGALLLALLTPERYREMIARGAEYGDDRIIVGAHYAMDVIAGRTLATYDVAHLHRQRSRLSRPDAERRARHRRLPRRVEGGARRPRRRAAGGLRRRDRQSARARTPAGSTIPRRTKPSSPRRRPTACRSSIPRRRSEARDVATLAPEAAICSPSRSRR